MGCCCREALAANLPAAPAPLHPLLLTGASPAPASEGSAPAVPQRGQHSARTSTQLPLPLLQGSTQHPLSGRPSLTYVSQQHSLPTPRSFSSFSNFLFSIALSRPDTVHILHKFVHDTVSSSGAQFLSVVFTALKYLMSRTALGTNRH